MKRIARVFAIAATGLLAGLPSASNAFAQSNRSKAALHRASEPTIHSVLKMAQELAETARHEAFRIPLRSRVGVAIRRTKHDSEFGDYARISISAWTEWDPKRASIGHEIERLSGAIEERAKRAFLAGDVERANSLLRERACKFSDVQCKLADFGNNSIFLSWEIEAGDFPAAIRRIKENESQALGINIVHVRLIVMAFVKAGRQKEAVEFLSGLPPLPAWEQEALAELYWRCGAVEKSRKLMSEYAMRELDDAARDPKKPIPVRIFAVQWALGDKNGALETLHRIDQFAKSRRDIARAPIAGALSLAGRDADAMALLTHTPGDRAILAYIVAGQARRGDFNAAFKSIEKLRGYSAPRLDDTFPAPQIAGIMLSPRMEDTIQNPGAMTATVTIERIAAREGNIEAFEKADEIRRALNPPGLGRWAISMGIASRNNPETYALADLARSGHAALAIRYALLTENLDDRVFALCTVAEGLAGVPERTSDAFGFFERW